MDTMEYEALRRASQMRKSADMHSKKSDNPPHSVQSTKAEEVQKSKPQSHNEQHPLSKGSSDLLGTMLFHDKEKLLILLLLMLLASEENSDPTIVLALLYLII